MGAQCVFGAVSVSPSPVPQSAEKKMMIEARAGQAVCSTVTRLELALVEDYQMPT